MEQALPLIEDHRGAARLADEALCLGLGAGLTLAIFFCVAHFERAPEAAARVEIEDARVVSAIAEPPPPKVEVHPDPVSVASPLTGLEIATSDSPVRIAVVPPDMDKIIPPTDLPPKATIQFSQIFSDLKPKAGPLQDIQHIYQQSEVDQVPTALVKTIARVSRNARDNADQLRATLLLVIDTEGAVSSIRVVKPSGNPAFDKAVLECVRDEWVFSPAIKKGRKVKCMVQQLIWYKWTEGSKFTL